MNRLSFDCPEALAKKFWVTSRRMDRTIGEFLREIMLKEIEMHDPDFVNRYVSKDNEEA